MVAIVCLSLFLVIVISGVGLATIANESQPSTSTLNHVDSQKDALAVARLGTILSPIPNGVLIETKLSSIRHSQLAQSMLAPLCRSSGMDYGDLITTIERKFAKVDGKVFNLIRLAEKIQLRNREREKHVEGNLEPWLASMNLSPQRISQLIGGVDGSLKDQSDSGQALDMESVVEEEEEEEEENEEREFLDQSLPIHEKLNPGLSSHMMLVQDLSRSHDLKYKLLFDNLEALMKETKILRFLEKFTEINEFLNAYIGHLDAQTSQLRKIESPEVFARLSNW